MITDLCGNSASSLGLAAAPRQDPRCVRRAFRSGINFFFFYGPGYEPFLEQLALLVRTQRERVIVATGSGGRKRGSLSAARRRIVAALGTELIDVFFAEYVTASDNPKQIFGDSGVLDQLQQWKAEGWIRYAGATTHDQKLAKQLAQDARVNVLMHRFNMAHRKAVKEVFPIAMQTETPVVAFTATRWGSLLKPNAQWSGEPPIAADCYRYCLAHPAVHLVLSAPQSLAELKENLQVLKLPPMSHRDRARWERFGDLIHGQGADAFETRWP
jgi:aryl-alcohol dehydrogenase-like predicted oxidoreductase